MFPKLPSLDVWVFFFFFLYSHLLHKTQLGDDGGGWLGWNSLYIPDSFYGPECSWNETQNLPEMQGAATPFPPHSRVMEL